MIEAPEGEPPAEENYFFNLKEGGEGAFDRKKGRKNNKETPSRCQSSSEISSAQPSSSAT